MNFKDLPVSITNWIILFDCMKESSDSLLYKKRVKDYALLIPLYKIYEIFSLAETHLTESKFQLFIEELWLCAYTYEEKHSCLRTNCLMQH